MIVQQSFMKFFDFNAMPVRSDKIAAWLRGQPRGLNFPFFTRRLVTDDVNEAGDKILNELMEFSHDGFLPFREIGKVMQGLHHIMSDAPDVAAAEIALLFFTDGRRCENLPFGAALSGHSDPVSDVEHILMSREKSHVRKLLDLRSAIARDHLGEAKPSGELSMDYLKFLDEHVLPHFFTHKSSMDEFDRFVYPCIIRLFALLNLTGRFQFPNDSYTVSFAEGADLQDALKQVRSETSSAQWKINIALPRDVMPNAELNGFFGLFTEKPFGDREKVEAKDYANISGGLSRYPAAPEMLVEICSGLFCMSLDTPRYAGMNCLRHEDGRLYDHAPAGHPDAYAVYEDGTVLTLEPSLNDGKTEEDWLTDIKAAKRHATEKLSKYDSDVPDPAESHQKFSFLLVRDLKKSKTITDELLKIAATDPAHAVIPMNFGMMQEIVRSAGLAELHTLSPDAVREFLTDVKQCMASLYVPSNAEQRAEAHANGEGGDMQNLLKLARDGDLQRLMPAIIMHRLRILTEGKAQSQTAGNDNTPTHDGGMIR